MYCQMSVSLQPEIYKNEFFKMQMRTRRIAQLMTLLAISTTISAQNVATDSVAQPEKKSKLTLGGYGEAAFSRNFYSDNQYRYSRKDAYKNAPSNGRFDIPHAVIYLGYDFGKGWSMGTEIEFEHTGTGSAIEIATDEDGEYEHEIEKGGEVELEQFWIQKTFRPWANLRIGHIIVPVGLNNSHDEPLDFFTVCRPEGENTILPNIWHDTGFSLWGEVKNWKYEVQMIAGLNALQFSRNKWAHNAAGSPFEFKPANKYGFVLRLDNYSIDGLRLGLSGYYGLAMYNTYPNEMEEKDKINDKVRGNVFIGSIDFTYEKYNWIVRGQADYGTLSDASVISNIKANTPKQSPFDKTAVGKAATAIGIEAGYDVFSQIAKMKADNQKLYIFGRYDFYDSYIHDKSQSNYDYTRVRKITFGLNYLPIPQVVLKANFAERLFLGKYNNEPSINIGIAYQGFFL